jgi:membrane protein required for colicin V production
MDNLPVNGVDIAVGLILLISAFLAYSRGFVHELLSVAGWLGAIGATFYGLPLIRPYARKLIPYQIAADVGAGIIIFIATLVILSFITRAISDRVRKSTLNLLDRALGFIFGILRGAFLILLVYMVVEWIMPADEQPAWLRNARSMPAIEAGTEALRTIIPDNSDFGGFGGP